MNRLDKFFAKSNSSDHKAAFIPYFCAGDPNYNKSLDIMFALANSGADIIELGMPFSDPMADGVANQEAALRALEKGMNLNLLFKLISDFRKKNTHTPIVLYTYLNPIYQYGVRNFLRKSLEQGIDGLLVLDLPAELTLSELCGQKIPSEERPKIIRLIAPTSDNNRIRMICAKAEGFIYYVSREGVTGARSSLPKNLQAKIDLIRRQSEAEGISKNIPIAIGFGISKPEQCRAIAQIADAIVVGSALVTLIKEKSNSPDLIDDICSFCSKFAMATH